MRYGSLKLTQMPPVHAANLVTNSGNTAYGVDVIEDPTPVDKIYNSSTGVWASDELQRLDFNP